MPKVFLKQSFVENPPLPTDKPKIQYSDEKIAGFILEVSKTGRATYYLRYRDKSSKKREHGDRFIVVILHRAWDQVKHLPGSRDERKFTPVGGVEGIYSMKRLGAG